MAYWITVGPDADVVDSLDVGNADVAVYDIVGGLLQCRSLSALRFVGGFHVSSHLYGARTSMKVVEVYLWWLHGLREDIRLKLGCHSLCLLEVRK